MHYQIMLEQCIQLLQKNIEIVLLSEFLPEV